MEYGIRKTWFNSFSYTESTSVIHKFIPMKIVLSFCVNLFAFASSQTDKGIRNTIFQAACGAKTRYVLVFNIILGRFLPSFPSKSTEQKPVKSGWPWQYTLHTPAISLQRNIQIKRLQNNRYNIEWCRHLSLAVLGQCRCRNEWRNLGATFKNKWKKSTFLKLEIKIVSSVMITSKNNCARLCLVSCMLSYVGICRYALAKAASSP